MFAKMLHRYHHLGEKLVALYYTGWTWLAIHEDGEADWQGCQLELSAWLSPPTFHAIGKIHRHMPIACAIPKFHHQISSFFFIFFWIFIMLLLDLI